MFIDVLFMTLFGVGVFYGFRAMNIIIMIVSDEPFPQSYDKQRKYGNDEQSRKKVLLRYVLIVGLSFGVTLYLALKYRSHMLY